MALMPKLVTLVNRTSKVLLVKFDGEDYRLQPGENTVPEVIVPFARAQNVLMGSENEVDPNDYITLVGVPGKDDISPLEQDENEPTRVSLQSVVGPSMKVKVIGKKKRSAFEAAVPGTGGGGVLSER